APIAAAPNTSRSSRLPPKALAITAGTVTKRARSAEFDLDQRAAGDPILGASIASAQVLEDAADHLTPLGLVGDRASRRGQISLHAPLQVEGELGVHKQVRVPVA